MGNVCELRLRSKFRFVTSEEQVLSLTIELKTKSVSIENEVIFIDSSLKGSRNVTKELKYIILICSRLNATVVLVSLIDLRFDRDVREVITRKARIVSKPIREPWISIDGDN